VSSPGVSVGFSSGRVGQCYNVEMKLVDQPCLHHLLPPMGSIALGAAFAAVQLVHQAYSKVKTSKARCARLVERCQFIVERLERIAMTKREGDAVIRERIRELEKWVAR
jgi:hypothetical protein